MPRTTRALLSPENLERHLAITIERHKLLAPGQKVVVAVSGGCDSMVLLDLLHRLAPTRGWQLAVAHFNHQLRGADSEADEAFVRQQADLRKLPVFVDRGDVRDRARQEGLSLEMAARQLRLCFLAETARRFGAPTVALGHHADDQVELFFLRLLRGAGGEGLEGMHWKSPVPLGPADAVQPHTQLHWVRPLLDLPRAVICHYAKVRALPHREDVSNRSWDILRNRIRHELVPLLESHYQPALRQVILRLMELVGADAAAVRLWAERWLRTGRSRFDRLPEAVQRAALRLQLRQLGQEPTWDLVEQLRLRPQRRVSGGLGRWYLRDAAGQVSRDPGPPGPFRSDAQTVQLGRRGSIRFGSAELRWHIQRHDPGRLPPRQEGVEHFDAERVGSVIRLRFWQPGDRFQPLGWSQAAKLQDLFTAARVPAVQRRHRLVATTSQGEIFWVEGLPPGERFKLTAATRRRLRWQWQQVEQTRVAANPQP